MIQTHKYRMYPTEEQKVLLAKHFGHCRWAYNWGLETKKKEYESVGKSSSCFELQKKLTDLKKKEEMKWLSEVSAQALQQSLTHLDAAYNNFFAKRSAFPTFKSKYNSTQSYTLAAYVEIDWGTGKINLPKFKQGIKTRLSRKIVGPPRKCTVSKNASNQYHISICFETGTDLPTKENITSRDEILGIDVGLKDFAITSEGEVVENPKFLNRNLDRLALLQQRLSHKKKGSKNREKAKLAVAKQHQKIVNQRTDFLHKLSTRLVGENQAIAREDLNVSGMLKNHNLAQAISDVSWSTFDSMVSYKCERQGKWYLRIGRWDASSKTCNVCSYVKKDLKLSDRSWVCPICKTVHDRDVNAALNIRNWAWIAWLHKGKVPQEVRKLMPVSVSNHDGLKAEGVGARGSKYGAGINRVSVTAKAVSGR